MTWTDLLRQGSVERRAPDALDLRDLLNAGKRQMDDAAVKGLSPEAVFQLAYTGVLTLATAAIRAAGYRLRSGEGHHRRAFEAATIALGADAQRHIDFFELCRRKRNVISYEGSEASASEAADLLSMGREFEAIVRRSLEKRPRG